MAGITTRRSAVLMVPLLLAGAALPFTAPCRPGQLKLEKSASIGSGRVAPEQGSSEERSRPIAAAAAALAMILLGSAPTMAALSTDKGSTVPTNVAPGSIPADLVATAVGQKVTTPNGVVYEPLELGTSETGPRNGPPRGGANLLLKYAAHIQSFDGPVVDSSTFRGSRKPNKVDYVECRLNVDPSLPNCLFEAVKLMKVGAKGRAVCPPSLSYGEGKVAFDADENADVKKVEAGSTLYYDLELIRIIKP